MSEIKKNDLAFLKTTGEVVFVLDFLPDDDVKVRRPVFAHTSGIYHMVETFKLQELETEVDHQKRERKQFTSLKDQIQAELDGQCVIGMPAQAETLKERVN